MTFGKHYTIVLIEAFASQLTDVDVNAKSGLSLNGFSYSNFMGDHNSRSVIGNVFNGYGIVSCYTKGNLQLQTSTNHAEVSAYFHSVKELLLKWV